MLKVPASLGVAAVIGLLTLVASSARADEPPRVVKKHVEDTYYESSCGMLASLGTFVIGNFSTTILPGAMTLGTRSRCSQCISTAGCGPTGRTIGEISLDCCWTRLRVRCGKANATRMPPGIGTV